MWSWVDSELLFNGSTEQMVWNVRAEYPLSKAKRYGSLADVGSRGRGDNEGRAGYPTATGGSQSGEEGWPHFVTPLA